MSEIFVENSDREAVEVVQASGDSEIVLVCEHASAEIPAEYEGLGLSPNVSRSHIGWDLGASEMAEQLAKLLGAALVRSKVSRLLYDCNRPPQSPDAIRSSSEFGIVPGNTGLTADEVVRRTELYYRPFERALEDTLHRHQTPPVLVTVHSFTPVFDGVPRAVEIGVLHDEDARLADAVLAVADGFNIARNAPYGPEDGVTHTLRRHGLANGLLNVMIEVRNDLLATPEQSTAMAESLRTWLGGALTRIHAGPVKASGT